MGHDYPEGGSMRGVQIVCREAVELEQDRRTIHISVPRSLLVTCKYSGWE